MTTAKEPFKLTKRKKIKIALQLGYDKKVIERLEQCTDIYELEKIMTYARYNIIEKGFKNDTKTKHKTV